MKGISGAKATVGTDTGKLIQVDVIEWQGKVWLVPQWLVSLDQKTRRPRRIICLSNLQHQVPGPGKWGYVVNNTVPESLMGEGVPERVQGFFVVELPDIELPGPGLMN